MDETSEPKRESSTEGAPEGEVTEEFRRLGDNLKEILRAVWESAERRKLQNEIQAGLAELEASLNKTAQEIRESRTGRRLETELKDFSSRVRTGEVETELRENLLSLLREVNSKLEKSSGPTSERPGGSSKQEG